MDSSEVPRGFYLFVGPDRPRKLQRIQALERALRVSVLDRHQLDAASVSATDLVALCRQQPADGSARLIVVDEAQRLTNDCVEALVRHAAAIVQSACVVLLIETEVSLRHGLAPYLRGAPLPQGGAMRTEQFPGRDTPTVKPFALVDALGARDVAGALVAVRDQLLGGKDPLELLGLVGWQLQRWVMVKRLLNAGYSAERIASIVGLRPWQVQRVESEVAHRSLTSLQQLLTRCWQLDANAKRGLVIPGLAIEQLVVEVCEEGRAGRTVERTEPALRR